MTKLILTSLIFLINSAFAATEPSRMTHIGPDFNKDYDAEESSLAYNSTNDEYLIVFESTQSITSSNNTLETEVEIYGQRIDASKQIIGNLFRISTMGPDGNTAYDARKPDVVYNTANNEYLVVWYGDSNTNGTIEGEFEIWGMRINAQTGQTIGSQFKISDMGPTANRSYDAIDPVVAYNSNENTYLVIWRGEDGNLVNAIGEFEIYGQQLNSSGQEIGSDDFRVSDMGTNGSSDFDAFSPALSYNAISNEFMAVWYGDDNRNGHVSGEFEIYGQRINASTGAELGINDFLISETGVPGFITRSASFPDICWNSTLNQYLVVWSADPATGAYVGNEFEIFGQVLAANGNNLDGDFPISDMGPIGNNNYDAFKPKVDYIAQSEQYAVAFRGDDTVDGEFEIYLQRLDASSLIRIGKKGERLSHAGPDNNILYDARRVALTHNQSTGDVMVIWEQENESETQTLGELEIYSSSILASPFTLNNTITGSWYDTNRDGEGYIVEILPNNTVLMVWFTYLPNQSEQAWLIGTGSLINNRVTFKNMQLTSGGVFGPNFNPNQVLRTNWGDVSLEFDACDKGTVNYNSVFNSYASGDHTVSRLTNVDGANCMSQTQSTDPLKAITGTWYDPTHDGEGWLLEYLGNNTVLMYWFTYDNLGNQKWLLSVGNIDANHVLNFDSSTMTNGTFFGERFNAANVNKFEWGTIQMIINDCNSITVSYDSPLTIYNQGMLNAQRLTNVDGIECQL
jgi:hypothetical protein